MHLYGRPTPKDPDLENHDTQDDYVKAISND